MATYILFNMKCIALVEKDYIGSILDLNVLVYWLKLPMWERKYDQFKHKTMYYIFSFIIKKYTKLCSLFFI